MSQFYSNLREKTILNFFKRFEWSRLKLNIPKFIITRFCFLLVKIIFFLLKYWKLTNFIISTIPFTIKGFVFFFYSTCFLFLSYNSNIDISSIANFETLPVHNRFAGRAVRKHTMNFRTFCFWLLFFDTNCLYST